MTFEELNGHRITFEGEEYEFGVGRYHYTRDVAIWLVNADGEPEDKLTVFLVEEKLDEGEFFVPITEEHERTIRMCEATGLFVRTGRVVGSGRVERYAEAWRLA